MRVTSDYKIAAVEHFREVRDFGIRDEKGRAVGIILTVHSRDYIASPNGCGYELPSVGTWFLCYAKASRDGAGYGASNSIHFEPMLEKARAWCEGRAASTFKSYQRKYK